MALGRATCCTSPTRRTICCGRVDLTRRQVTTIAGTGEQGDGLASVRLARVGRLRRAAAVDAAQQPVGTVGARQRPVHRDGRARIRFGRCRSTRARSARTPATAARTSSTARCCRPMPYDDRLRVVRAAERPDLGRQAAVRRRQRREHGPRRAVRSGRQRAKRSSASTGTLFDFGDVDGTGRDVRLAASARRRVVPTASCTSPTRTTTRSR